MNFKAPAVDPDPPTQDAFDAVDSQSQLLGEEIFPFPQTFRVYLTRPCPHLQKRLPLLGRVKGDQTSRIRKMQLSLDPGRGWFSRVQGNTTVAGLC